MRAVPRQSLRRTLVQSARFGGEAAGPYLPPGAPVTLSGLAFPDEAVSWQGTGPSRILWAVTDAASQTAEEVEAAAGAHSHGSFLMAGTEVETALSFGGTPDGTRYLHVVGRTEGGLSNVLSIARVFSGGLPVTGYDVFLLAGQSNMVGWGLPFDPVLDAGDPRIVQWGRDGADDGLVVAALDPMQHWDAPGEGVGPAMTFAREYLADGRLAAGRQLLLVPAGQGGSGFADGLWGPAGTLFTDAVARAGAALALDGAELKAILWHQGEDDVDPMTPGDYEVALDACVANLRAALGDVPFVCGGLVPGWVGADADRLAHVAVIADLPNRISYTAFADPTESPAITTTDIHFTAADQRLMGARYYAAYQAALTHVVAPSEPDAFGDAAWSLDAAGAVAVHALPDDNGAAIGDIEYRVDGGAAVSSGTDDTSGFATGAEVGEDVEIRAVNAVGAGPWSNPRTVTAAGPAVLFTGDGLWFDPSDLSTVWQDAAGTVPGAVGQPVGRIDDKSGNGNHLVQATSGLRPVLQTDGVNTYVDFTGTGWLATASGRFNVAAITLAMGWRADSASTDRMWFCLPHSGALEAPYMRFGVFENGTHVPSVRIDGTEYIGAGGGMPAGDAAVYTFSTAVAAQTRDRTNTIITATPGGVSYPNAVPFVLGAFVTGSNVAVGRFYGLIAVDYALGGADLVLAQDYLDARMA